MNVYLVLGIYFEEGHYRCEAIEGVNLTLEGAAKKLTELVSTRPYDEYEIRPIYFGK